MRGARRCTKTVQRGRCILPATRDTSSPRKRGSKLQRLQCRRARHSRRKHERHHPARTSQDAARHGGHERHTARGARPNAGEASAADSTAGHRQPHHPPLVQRPGRQARRRAGDGQPQARVRRPHVQRWPHRARRHRSAQSEAGPLLHCRNGHPHAPAANRGGHAAARQWREHRGDAVLRRHARLLREQPRRQHHQPEEVPLGTIDPRHIQAARDARNRVSRNARAWASTASGGRAGATRTCRRISTATPTTSSPSST